MKTLQAFILSIFFFSFTQVALAQDKTDSFKVAGECGMCKKKIETAAKAAGASFAAWNVESKELVVKYNNTTSNTAKMQQAIAGAGYDTPTAKATEEAYSKLHECCKYDRAAAAVNKPAAACCSNTDCCKEGKCTADAACCKDQECSADNKAAACCKKA